MDRKVIGIEELKRHRNIKVYISDSVREKHNAIEINGVIVRNIYRIISKKGRLIVFQNIDGKEIARVVLHPNEHLEIDREFSTYDIVS